MRCIEMSLTYNLSLSYNWVYALCERVCVHMYFPPYFNTVFDIVLNVPLVLNDLWKVTDLSNLALSLSFHWAPANKKLSSIPSILVIYLLIFPTINKKSTKELEKLGFREIIIKSTPSHFLKKTQEKS